MNHNPRFFARMLVTVGILAAIAIAAFVLQAGAFSTVQAQTGTGTPTGVSTTSTAVAETPTTAPETAPAPGTPTVTPAPPTSDMPPSTARTNIGVSGTGRVSVAPDTAIASVGVEITAPTLGEATTESSTTMTAVLDAIKGAGVADEDIQTTGYNIFPITNIGAEGQQTPSITGYRVNNIVTIKIRNIDDVSTVIDAALGAGANSVNSVSFVLDDPTEAQNRARTIAVQDAMAKAASLADAAGVSVGPLVSISELQPGAVPFSNAAAMSAVGGAGPIQTGMTEVSVTVEMHFEIAR